MPCLNSCETLRNETMSSLRQYLECSICLAAYKQPKMLSCLHIFCLQCIKDFFKDEGAETIKCPLCRQLTTMPEDGIETLPDYIGDTDIDASQEGGDYCGFCCSDSVAEFRCRDCEDSLCLKCKEQHLRMKQTKGHVLDVLEETKKEYLNEVVNCKFHDMFHLQYYCLECNAICCEMGLHGHHKRHTVKSIHEVAEEKRAVLKALVNETKEEFTPIVNDISDILIEQDKLYTLLEKSTEGIDCVANRLKRSIDDTAEKIKSQMNELGETLIQKLQTSLETSNSKAKSVISVIQSTSEIMNEASDHDFLGLQSDVVHQMQEEQRKAKTKDVRVTYLNPYNIEDTFFNSIRKKRDVTCNRIVFPLILNKLSRSFTVEGNDISAIACLDNGSILVCQGHGRRLNVLSTSGADFGSFTLSFKIGNVVPVAGGSLVVTEFDGSKIAYIHLYNGTTDLKRLPGYLQGVSVTYDRNCVIVCCNDTKANSRKHAVKSRIIITSLSLDEQMQVNVNSCEEVIKYAVQRSNGDFIAMSTTTCFILSTTGCLKSTLRLEGRILAACLDKHDNLIVVRADKGSNVVTLYDCRLDVKRNLISLSEDPNSSTNFCMAVDDNGTLWVGFGTSIQSIKYTF